MDSNVFGPVENSANTLPSKFDQYFQRKIEILKVSDINLSVFLLISYESPSPDLENLFKSKLTQYDQFKQTAFDQKPAFLNRYNQRITKDADLGYLGSTSILPSLQNLFSSLKAHNVGICLFYLESFDSCIKVLKFCEKNKKCNVFFYQQIDKSENKEREKIYLLIPRLPNIPFLTIENFFFKSNRFMHTCGKSLLKSELLFNSPLCRKCKGELNGYIEQNFGNCIHGVGLKIVCGVAYCNICALENGYFCSTCENPHNFNRLDYARINSSVASGYGICNFCRNYNYISANYNGVCVDCYYDLVYSGRLN